MNPTNIYFQIAAPRRYWFMYYWNPVPQRPHMYGIIKSGKMQHVKIRSMDDQIGMTRWSNLCLRITRHRRFYREKLSTNRIKESRIKSVSVKIIIFNENSCNWCIWFQHVPWYFTPQGPKTIERKHVSPPNPQYLYLDSSHSP